LVKYRTNQRGVVWTASPPGAKMEFLKPRACFFAPASRPGPGPLALPLIRRIEPV
jgi:hypothetical protein